MAVELLDDLERKVDILIKALADVRKDNAALKKEIESCRDESKVLQEKLGAAAERIQNVLKKISAV